MVDPEIRDIILRFADAVNRFYKGVGCVKQVEGSDTYTITGSYINGVQQAY